MTGGTRRLIQRAGRGVVRAPAEAMVLAARLYQVTLSPFVGRQCRYLPTCSNYFIGAVRKYGAIKGGLKGVGRLLRCHPFSKGGYDPP